MTLSKYRIIYSLFLVYILLLGCQPIENKTTTKANRIDPFAKEDDNIDLKELESKEKLKATIQPTELQRIIAMQSLPEQQIRDWLLPLSNNIKGEDVKIVSFQGKKENSIQIIIANIFEFYDFEDEKYFDMEQYFISVDIKTGKLIDGVRIQGHKSGDSLGDSIIANQGLILNIKTTSIFDLDTIIISNKISLLNPPDSHNEKDILEKIITKKYMIRKNGMLKEQEDRN